MLRRRKLSKRSSPDEARKSLKTSANSTALVFESLEPRLLLAADPLGITVGYAFNETSGTTAVDVSGHGITGTLTSGAAFTTAGKYGNAVALDGVNDYVNLGNPAALRLSGSMTVSAWIYSTAFPADDAAIVSKKNADGFQLDTTVDTGPRTIGFKLTNSFGGDMMRYGATALQPNTWYYVTGVYNAAAQTLDVYLNGALDNGVLKGTITSSQQNSSNVNVMIGRRAQTGYEFIGRIDDVRIADHALTPDQILTDMTTPLGGAPAPDTTAPTITLTAPTAGAVSGTVTVTATASDNIGVAGVQFLLDGALLGAEATTTPYLVSWDTTTATNASHTLLARARDAAGNFTDSAPLTLTVSNTTAPAPDTDPLGITAGYAFNETSGTTTVDVSGHGITGTLTSGAAFTTAGKYGNAVALDGVNDYVNLGNPAALRLSGSMTVSAWIYSTAFPADDAAIVSKKNADGFQLDTTVDTGPRTIGFKLTNSFGGDMMRYGATALQPNTWYYVTGVYNAAAQTLDVYLNGALDNGVLKGTITSSQQNSSNVNVMIGRRAQTGYEFIGRIDDVRIADHALTPDQILTDMTTPLGGAPAPDTTAPTITLTAPTAGAVSGTVTVTATASDNIGVAGVQFLLDGALLGAEATTTPYLVSWDTTTATNASHTLLARARDAAGNFTDSAPLTLTVSNTTAPAPDTDPLGITAGYAFNETSGTTTVDVSGHGITGTLTSGAAFTTAGKYGNAVALDGVNDYVNLGNPAALRLSGSMTVSAWIYSTAFPADDAAIVSKKNADGFQLDTTVDTGPRTIGFKLTNSFGGDMMRYGATALQPNTWYYVTGVYNAAAQTLDVYLNGALDNGVLKGTITSSQQNSSNVNVMIGRRAQTGYEFIGRIDDVRIADHALTPDQILTDMTTPLGGAPAPDTTAPTITLTAPTAGAVSGTVTVTATASDNIGVAGVQFLLDGALLGAEATTTPYLVSWDTTTATNASHTLLARARDAAGNFTDSAPLTLTVSNTTAPAPDTTAPTITLTAPTAGAVSGSVTVTATASDNIGVAGVQFLLDDALLGAEATTTPYLVSWDTTTATNASHTLLARARDAAGNFTDSAPLTLTVSNTTAPAPDTTAPTITLTAPTAGAVSGTVTVTATASDNIGVAGVQFLLDGALLGAEATTTPYLVSWDTTTATNASHTLLARARDAAGNFTDSAPLTLTVSNTTAPAPDPTAPTQIVGLPADRLYDWNPGLNSIGGVPNRTTVFTTVFPGGDIQAAIDAAPPGQVVQLAAGTFTVNNFLLINKDITLRGTVDPVTNAPLTFLQKTNGATAGSYTAADYQPIIIVGTTRWPQLDSSWNLTSDAVAGTYSITLASTAGLSPGQFVILDEDDYTSASFIALPNRNGSPTSAKILASDRVVFMDHNPPDPGDDPFPDSLTWFSRANRPLNELKEIASISGNTVTFTSPITITYTVSKNAQLTSFVDTFVKYAGIENLSLKGGSDGNIRFEAAAYSWMKNVENTGWLGEGVAIDKSFRIEVRDSYIHDGAWSAPGGGGYAISLASASAEALIENNIILHANKMMVGRSAGAGTVVAYNYTDDGFINYDPSWQEVGINGSHMVGSHSWLFEGNESFNYDSDNTHGNAIYMTVFRNNLTGDRTDFSNPESNARAAGLMFGSWWQSIVGNVLGTSGQMAGWTYQSPGLGNQWGNDNIWEIGYDPQHWEQDADPKTISTLIRGGNYDYVTSSVHWENIPAQTLPLSLYLSGKPAFFGSYTWPWVDPTGSTKLYILPAKARYDAGTPFALPPGGAA